MNGKGKTTTANDPSPLIPLPLGRGEGGDCLRATYYKHGAKNVASTECPQGEGKRKAWLLPQAGSWSQCIRKSEGRLSMNGKGKDDGIPPHPGPLPQGEGDGFRDLRLMERMEDFIGGVRR